VMRRVMPLALAGLLIGVSACAPKSVPAPVVSQPRFPEFLKPVVPVDAAQSIPALRFDRGWAFLQDADFRNAEREFSSALRYDARFSPAESGLGYLELARKEPKASLSHFDRALESQPRDPSSLVGRGEALAGLGRDADAVAAFEAALAVNPSLPDVSRRVEVLRFRSVEQNLATAREAAKAGKSDDAVRAYQLAIASSPDSAFLYRELGQVQRRAGRSADALANFRKAVELDATDAASYAQIGELLEASGDFQGAERAYDTSLDLERSDEVAARRDAVRAQIALTRLPEQYRAIPDLPQVTRADLAALIGVQLEPLVRGMQGRDPGVITDIRGHWAESWIVSVTRAGVLEAFDNHTFQPRTVVRRVDLAQVIARLLPRAAAMGGVQPSWQSARLNFADIAPSHLAYPAASTSVAAGILEAGPQSTFEPSRAISGKEAVEAVTRLARLAKLSAARSAAAR